MYQEYPKVMTHPAESKAVVHGDPARLQPVTVNSPDQEAEYEAKGYRAFSDEAAYDRAKASVKPTTYRYQEYPKWVGDKVVNSRAEEDALFTQSIPTTADMPMPVTPPKPDKRSKEYRESVAAA